MGSEMCIRDRAIAAVLAGNLPDEVKTVAVILSGGNVDPDVFEIALRGH